MSLFSRQAKRTNILSLALVFCLVLIILLSLGYILIHAGHHCTGEHCPICEKIVLCANAMHLVSEWVLVSLVCFFFAGIVLHKLLARPSDLLLETPVLRHVRMNR
jgi:hypothetical protein